MFSRPIKRINVKEESPSTNRDFKPKPTMQESEEIRMAELSHLTNAQTGDVVNDNLLPGGPYATSNVIVKALYKLSSLFFIPWCFVLDYFLSMFIHTSDGTYQAQSRRSFYFCVKALLTLVILLCLTPLALFAFIIWFPLQLFRPRPYSYISPDIADRHGGTSDRYERIATVNPNKSSSSLPLKRASSTSTKTYFVLTGNLCLMPEFVAHINNLTNSVSRGKKMSAYFCGDMVANSQGKGQKSADGNTKTTETDFLMPSWSADSINVDDYEEIAGDSLDSRSVTSTLWSITSKERAVSDAFPGPADFLCLQEVFDSRATDQLIQGLKAKYPYIIYDVAWPIHNYRMTLLGSGLCIASRHPFIDIAFKPFPDGNRDDKLACKGVLMTKVYLGTNANGEDLVGYLATTHLQAWSHTQASNTRCRQLTCLDEWMHDFYQSARKRNCDATEIVLFNVITGDFNFDKVSHFDQNEQTCSFLRNYQDPCIDESGAQHSWVVGTELCQKKMHDEVVRTPQGLQRMLVSELERYQYVASTMPNKSSLQRVGDGKRRIDYILYKDCEHVSLNVRDYKFFTGLATLTDHIPVGMLFSCDIEES